MNGFCRHCGEALEAAAAFCSACGRPVAVGAAPRPAAATGPETATTGTATTGTGTPGAGTAKAGAATKPPAAPGSPAPGPSVRLTREDLFEPPSKGRTGRVLAIAGGVAGGLVLLAVAVAVVQSVVFGPKAAVTGYFAALSDRDAAGALDTLLPGGQNTGAGGPGRDLLADGALRAGAYTPPTAVRITMHDGKGDTRTATARYDVDGQHRTVQLRVVREQDTTLLVFRRWRLEGGLGFVRLPAGVPYRVGGVTAASAGTPGTEDAAATGLFTAFPGRYRVGFAPNPLLSGTAKNVTVATPGSGGTADLEGKVVDGAAAEVHKQVVAYLDDCAEQAEAQPKNCPFQLYSSTETRNVAWTMKRYPRIKLAVQASDGSLGVRVSTDPSHPGTVAVTYEERSVFDDTYESRSTSYPVTAEGPVVVTRGKIDWLSPADLARG